jgi:hypothetical protein
MSRHPDVRRMMQLVAKSTLDEHVRKAAVEALAWRRRMAPPQVDNSQMPAGAQMIYYCRTCGHVCDIKHEAYIFPPYRHCSECQALIDLDWIEEH